MNKKFSTLVAGLLLAASFGTVDAQTYTMYDAGQTSAAAVKTFKKEGAFQLADGTGNVLAMVKDASVPTGKYVLKMVPADGSVKLAETLWTIRWTTYNDVVKKYYFTFESAAYNMPLSFSTENAGKGALSADVNYEFPGKIATWEWQDGIDANAGFTTAVALKYRFANPDSVMTLSVNAADNKVGVIKYSQAQGTTSALALLPKALNGVVLTAADLNSKMLTQNVSELLKLTFNTDVSKGATNLWTNKYEAMPAIGANEINRAVTRAINEAVAAAESVNGPAGAALIAKEAREIAQVGYTDAQKAAVEAVAAAAQAAATPVAAQAAAVAKLAEYTTALALATAVETYAKTIEGEYTGGSLATGTPTTIGDYKTAVKAVTSVGAPLTGDIEAEIQNAFIALVSGADGDTYVQPLAGAITTVVNGYTLAKEAADAAHTAADAAHTAAAAKTVDETDVAAAVTAVKDALNAQAIDDADASLDVLIAAATTSLTAAIEGVQGAAPAELAKYPANYAGYLSLHVPNSVDPAFFLRVDTTFLTAGSGNKHLAFRAHKFNGALKNSEKAPVDLYVQHDFNARFNFKFTYFPTEDSLVIHTPLADTEANIHKAAGFAHPATNKAYADMTNAEIASSWDVHTVQVGPSSAPNMVPENIVKIVVLNDVTKHREVTVGADEWVESTTALVPPTTLNTRIGFNVRFPESSAIPAGVYTIKYVSNDINKVKSNGRYITYNWLWNNSQFMASVENQELNHIPAAQWIVTQAKGENLNSIVNRESNMALVYRDNFSDVQQQYMYATATKGLYKTIQGDSLLFTQVPDEFTTDKTLGYFIDEEKNAETQDQLKVFSLKYLNNLNDDLFVGFDKDSILNVAKTDKEDLIYFRLIRATDSLAYGAPEVKDIAKQLKRIPFYLQLETANKNIKDEDKLFITVSTDGKYKLINSTLTKGKVDYRNLSPFFMKEFKEADTHYYAIIEADKNYMTQAISGRLGYSKISVKDYPSILVQEDLEGENQPVVTEYGYYVDGRTSTFALVEKEAPKYRRLGVTNPSDELVNLGTNVAKINITREDSRYLYENSANKVAGYEADPTGIDYLGALFNGEKKAAMFIDTAYVRNETARPQYLLAVRPDFTPDTTFCPVDHGHAYELVPQVRANYLVTLSVSVAAYAGNKPMLDKFMYENRTYTRLAFVDAIHQGDGLFIQSSKFKGTDLAKKDTIDLSKNGFNNAAVQFRLTKNDDQAAEFYIETLNNEFVRLINGVAVLTEDIADAERFNIAKTSDKPVSNEGIETATVKVTADAGKVVITGAQGKKVVISNILGQTIANTVIATSEAAISVPAGIVVVGVEGEAAVKAIVK